ncbi:MAG: pilus assembly protein TadG-related protein [Actinomycetota bacterium]|nr:pilus assembly protein TadG-related protein [Actinomycetota bacterium]
MSARRLLRDGPGAEAGSITLWLLGLCVALLFGGGTSLNLWRAFGQRRAVAGIVDAAASAASSGIDERHLRRSGELQLDPAEAEGLALALVDGHPEPALLTGRDVAATVGGITVSTSSVDLTLLRGAHARRRRDRDRHRHALPRGAP